MWRMATSERKIRDMNKVRLVHDKERTMKMTLWIDQYLKEVVQKVSYIL